jgi:hypothetical protein
VNAVVERKSGFTMGDIATLLAEIFDAEPGYLKAERYSRGKVREVWASRKVAKAMRRSAGKYPVNIARRPIDAVLDRLKIIGVAAESTKGKNDDKLTAVLNEQVWDANQLDLDVPDALDLAETYGDAYLICWPREESEADGVDVVGNDPKAVRVIYDPERPRRVLFSGRTWVDSRRHRRVTIWRDGPVRERYISKTPETARPPGGYADADFEPFMDNEEDSESWREDLQLGLGNPVFHLKPVNWSGYGVPTHESAYGTQNMLTKLIATLMDATDGYGFPFRYALTKSGTVGTTASLDDDWADGDSGTPNAPKQAQAEPGTLAKLTDTDGVGQLEPASVVNLLDPIGTTLRLSSVVSTTPLSYFDPSAASASGESKKEHEKPAVNKADKHLARYNATLKDCLAYAMALLGESVAGVVINWAPTQTVDDQADVTLAKSRQEAGVPLERTLVDLGYPEEDVKKWISEATPDDAMLEHRVMLLKELALAAQALGAAASLGVIDEDTARELITRMVNGADDRDDGGMPELEGGEDDGQGPVRDSGTGARDDVPAGAGA